VGRGSDVPRIRRIASEKNLANVMFHDEIEPSAIPALYAQCHAGLVALDARHSWHNIPGKFITYMHSGLPVLASVNPGNDLVEIVRQNRVGRISTDASGANLAELALEMLGEEMAGPATAERCRAVARRQFSATSAAGQIVQGLRERAGGEQ
jgi:glycosyltransferase involved in cell wall biosynthesis